MHVLLQGLTIGFSIAAPVGPIGLLCIRRAVADGSRAGFICGLGAAIRQRCANAKHQSCGVVIAAFGCYADRWRCGRHRLAVR
jgi:hypothetical protein